MKTSIFFIFLAVIFLSSFGVILISLFFGREKKGTAQTLSKKIAKDDFKQRRFYVDLTLYFGVMLMIVLSCLLLFPFVFVDLREIETNRLISFVFVAMPMMASCLYLIFYRPQRGQPDD